MLHANFVAVIENGNYCQQRH